MPTPSRLIKSFYRPKVNCNSLSLSGFTLAELLVIVLILGILSSVAISLSISVLRRQQANAFANDLAGWMGEIRDISSKAVDDASVNTVGGGCDITFSNSLLGVGNGSPVASATPNDCKLLRDDNSTQIGSQFVISNFSNSSKFDIKIDKLSSGVESGLGSNVISFTPRGTWIALSTPGSSGSLIYGDLLVKIWMIPDGPLKCLKMTETLAAVSIGENLSASSVNDTCPLSSFELL